MHMHNLERRVHLLLDGPLYREVSAEAKIRQVSVASDRRESDHFTVGSSPQTIDAKLQEAEPMLRKEIGYG